MAKISSMQRAIVYPPGVAPEIVEVMRRAVEQTYADEEFQAASEKQFGFQAEFFPGPRAHAAVVDILRIAQEDAEALEYVKRLVRERG
jgi:tripartite-type tricarboxylate transporter receptor subunit TctC